MPTHEKHDRATWLEGPSAKCSSIPKASGPAWRLVLLGAPGVGKGTQAEFLSQRLGACHLSTGDVFRAALNRPDRKQTPALLAALDAMRRGALVADSVVSEIVRERIDCIRCGAGFILDGFPRTLAQADLLKQIMREEGLGLNAVINYVLPEAEVISRLSGRRTCERCKAIFHLVSKPSRIQGVCDKCGGKLYQRDDDRLESIKVRLEAYHRTTAPLIEFYKNLVLLTPIDANGSPDDIYSRTLQALTNRAQNATELQLS